MESGDSCEKFLDKFEHLTNELKREMIQDHIFYILNQLDTVVLIIITGLVCWFSLRTIRKMNHQDDGPKEKCKTTYTKVENQNDCC